MAAPSNYRDLKLAMLRNDLRSLVRLMSKNPDRVTQKQIDEVATIKAWISALKNGEAMDFRQVWQGREEL